jgi:hypothetical protein
VHPIGRPKLHRQLQRRRAIRACGSVGVSAVPQKDADNVGEAEEDCEDESTAALRVACMHRRAGVKVRLKCGRVVA